MAAAMYGIVSAFVTVHYHWTAAALLPFGLLMVTAAAYLAAGILAFRLGERAARTRGTLGAY
jgi:hypothetical protein